MKYIYVVVSDDACELHETNDTALESIAKHMWDAGAGADLYTFEIDVSKLSDVPYRSPAENKNARNGEKIGRTRQVNST